MLYDQSLHEIHISNSLPQILVSNLFMFVKHRDTDLTLRVAYFKQMGNLFEIRTAK